MIGVLKALLGLKVRSLNRRLFALLTCTQLYFVFRVRIVNRDWHAMIVNTENFDFGVELLALWRGAIKRKLIPCWLLREIFNRRRFDIDRPVQFSAKGFIYS